MVFDPPSWFIKKIDRIRRNFLWAGDEIASGAKCMVNWKQICAPKDVGGLGIKNLKLFSRALRLCWNWLSWTDTSKPWKGLPHHSHPEDKALFQACTNIQIGNGDKTLFWKDIWHNGSSLAESFPELFSMARRKNSTVKAALHNGRWMKGLQRMTTSEHLVNFVTLWSQLQQIHLSGHEDQITWTAANNNTYNAASAYTACFQDWTPKPKLAAVWEVKIEGNIQFFLWLLVQNRLWTADRLEVRGWPHQDKCSLCDQTIESAQHLFLGCPYAKEIWQHLKATHSVAGDIACRSTSLTGWWKKTMRFRKNKNRRDQARIAIYGMWHLWKERNRRIFENSSCTSSALSFQIREGLQSLKFAFSE
jgi:hypothetical protein